MDVISQTCLISVLLLSALVCRVGHGNRDLFVDSLLRCESGD